MEYSDTRGIGLRIYRRMYELADSEKRDAIKECATNIALHYGWKL